MAYFPPPQLRKLNYHSAGVKRSCEGNLLQHQSEALARLEHWFSPTEGNPQIAIVSMPTGSGKTGIMCCLPYFLGNIGLQGGQEPFSQPTGQPVYPFDKPILVIAPDLAIASQLEQQMLVSREDLTGQTFLLKRGIVPRDRHSEILPTGVKIEETSDLQNRPYLEGKEIIIANAQKFLGEWEEALPDDIFRLVIVDEAHHHPATTWQRIVQKFQDHALVVFFTATPYRGDKKPVLEGHPLTYHLSLEEATVQGIIRKTEFKELTGTDSLQGISLRDDDDEDDDENDDASPPDREEIGRFATILREVRSLQTTKDQETPLPDDVPHMAMAITKDTNDANRLVELWNVLYPDAPAYAYHSKISEPQRKIVKAKLQNNKLKLVVVVAMLLEGFDHPPISIAAVATKIVSPVKFVQFVGRAQRIYRGTQGSEVNGIAHIVTHSHYEQGDNYKKFIHELLIPSQ